jgi:hypothetical protein
VLLVQVATVGGAGAADIFAVHSDPVPERVDVMYRRGLEQLIRTQGANGAWQDGYGAQPGVVGLALLAMLAYGEDPNYGPHAEPLRRGLDFILKSQNSSGYIGSSMYNHGFATLALAEAYGAVDDSRLGPALQRAVDLILTSQARNGVGAWRYTPTSNDADTTVSGAIFVALMAARNAGLAVPESAVKKALDYYKSAQSGDGGFGYTGGSGSNAPRTAIGSLVFALAKRKSSAAYKSANRYLLQRPQGNDGRPYYLRYYASQAFFHLGTEEWNAWNAANIQSLAAGQGDDGGWAGQFGSTFCTASALLSLALNYRFLPIYER